MHLQNQGRHRDKDPITVIIANRDNDIQQRIRNHLAACHRPLHIVCVDDDHLGDMLAMHMDATVLFLATEMIETAVPYVRNTLGNQRMRIILTDSGEAASLSLSYMTENDISDLLDPVNESTFRTLLSFQTALRVHDVMIDSYAEKLSIRHLMDAGDAMFALDTYEDFLDAVIRLFDQFQAVDQKDAVSKTSGFIAVTSGHAVNIVTATGIYKSHDGEDITLMPEFSAIFNPDAKQQWDGMIMVLTPGILSRHLGKDMTYSYIFVACETTIVNIDYVRLLMIGYAIAFDNLHIERVASQTRDEILFLLGEVVETQFAETGGHIRRVSALMRQFAIFAGYTPFEAEILRTASTMHDIGKIGIPEHILKKPGRLTDDEMAVMQTHANIGYDILKSSELEVFAVAATIAFHHHERFDGTGYPNRLAGYDIPQSARMMAIIDVYDAMTHDRIYRAAIKEKEVLAHIASERGKHFDPELADLFLSHIGTIVGK